MDYIRSEMTMDAYLKALRQVARPNFVFMDEFASGIVLGPFFAVAYHSPYEWNRRITRECNRAWGCVREVDGKTVVRFIRGKGDLAPLPFLLMTLFCRLIFLFGSYDFYMTDGDGAVWITSAVVAFICCVVSAVQSCITEEGEMGAGIVTKILCDPKTFYYY